MFMGPAPARVNDYWTYHYGFNPANLSLTQLREVIEAFITEPFEKEADRNYKEFQKVYWNRLGY